MLDAGVELRELELCSCPGVSLNEAFYTGTPFSILPCTKINGVAIGTGKTGSVTQKLINAWSKSVGLDIVEQAKRYAARTAGSARHGANPYQIK